MKSMKSMKRKLLSLLLAMAMILTLAPTALADNGVSIISAPTEVDAGETFTLSATVPEAPEGSAYTATWTTDGGTITGNTTGTSATVVAPDTGSFSVTVTVTDGANALVGSDTARISVKAAVVPVATTLALGTVEPSRLTAGSNDTAAITATVLDQNGNGMAEVPVTTTLSSDSTATEAAASTSVTTNSSGVATITVSPGSVAGTANFSVSAGAGNDLNKTFSVTVDSSKPSINLNTPTPANIYYGGSNNTATMSMEISGDTTGYTLSWNVTNKTALAAELPAEISSSYTLTANNVSTSTTVTIQAVLTNGSETITSEKVSLVVHPSEVFSLTAADPSNVAVINWSSLKLTGGYYRFSVSPSWVSNGSAVTITTSNVTYKWVLNNQILTNVTGLAVELSASDLSYSQNNSLICYATFKYPDGTTAAERSVEWTINMGYSSSVLATATVASSTSSYALGDLDDEGKSSIVDQLESYFYNTSRGYYGLVSASFDNVSDGSNGRLSASSRTTYYADHEGTTSRYLSDVLFYPGTVKSTATFQATFTYYNTRNPQSSRDTSTLTGAITFRVVEDASSGDITYSASIGDDVSFVMKDFEDFYYTKTRGTLSYVSFTPPTGGALYSDGGRLNASNACYVSPSRTQTDLAGVYFSPSGTTATRAGTVRISFTAYGTRSSGTSGTVAITYLSGTAKDIIYNFTTSGALKASDFTAAYKEVVGSTAPTGLTIEFQNVPTYGSLTYKDSSRSSSSTVTLRSNNIKSYKFTTRTSGSNQLGDVTYTVSSGHSDTIDYIAYVNNTPQFTGKVVFNGTNASATNMQVGFTSTNGQAVTFSYAEFAKANATVIAATSYIRFVTMPTGGTLTYNGTVMTISSTNVAPNMLGSVVYRPSAGFNNNTDRISFLCYDANGNSVGGGQVNIVVTGNSSNGAATVNSFKDVSATAWYRNDLITLVNAGIIQGRGDGKFDPTAELTYGEALKIFMLASGYPAQTEATGKDWAINYKNLAVSNGWISSTVDLSAKISRNAMAELAAKSLGVAPTDGVPPTWKDGTSNSYANALYYTNPQILIGNADGTFMGTSTLKRQEICAIACRVMNYRSNQQSSDKPGWLG